MKAVDITCKIKQEIINFILKETPNYSQNHGHNNGDNHQFGDGLDNIISEYIKNIPKTGIEPTFVETPPLLDLIFSIRKNMAFTGYSG